MNPDGKREAELRQFVTALPAGERLSALARLLDFVAQEDRTAHAGAALVEESRRKIEQLQDETAQLRLQLAETQSENGRVAARLKAEEDAGKTLRDSVTQLRAQFNDTQKRLADRDAQIDTLTRETEDLRRQVAEARQAAAATASGAATQDTRVAELQRRIIESQALLAAKEAEFGERLTARDAEMQTLREQIASGAAASAVPGWLAERVRSMKLEPVLPTESVDQAVVLRVINLFEVLADATINTNELLCFIMRRRVVEELPRFREQCQAYLKSDAVTLRELVRNALSPRAGAERIVQQRLRFMQQWLRALVGGSDAALDNDSVYKLLREFLAAPQREWRGVNVQKFATDHNGAALIARELSRYRGEKIAEAFDNASKGG